MGDRATDSASRAGRPAWVAWALSVAVVPLVLAVVAQFWPRPQIEDDLTSRTVAALELAGLPGASVSFDGRDAVLSGIPAGRESAALDVVGRVDGGRDVALAPRSQPRPELQAQPSPEQPQSTAGSPSASTASSTAASPAASTASPVETPASASSATVAAAGEPVVVRRAGDRVTVQATAPDETTKAQLIAAASAGAGLPAMDDVTVAPGATLPGEPAALRALVAALGTGVGDRSLRWSVDGIALTGTAPLPADIASIESDVRAAQPGAAVTNELAPPPPDKAAVQAALADVVISFRPDSADLTPEGDAGLRRVAEILRAAPGIRVEVGGHAGVAPGTADVAQKLSDDRAARACDALVAAGVPADALVTRGYGDTRPKADRAASRRAEITVL